ncbi:hypothetical protein P9246_10995 [Aeribacillus pallidus]|uniref:hypothetical protein n=2 Tax=Aeribacillus composti TaxID=1868734 RepID=UPI002E1F2FD3|nr:hypothetical protein [Aeribacillus composti]MED4487268.1 hypothetical protein [Aeribacillus pallidus]
MKTYRSSHMKKWLLLPLVVAGASLIGLVGCQAETKKSTQVEENQQKEQEQSKMFFSKEDRQIARKKAEQYIATLTEFNGRSVFKDEENEKVREELNHLADEQKLIHPESYFANPQYTSFINTNEDSKLVLSSDRFQLGDTFQENYYKYIDVHELTLPIRYKAISETSSEDVQLESNICFVKTADGEIYILSAPMLVGEDLKKKNEDAYYDEYNREEIKQEIKEELNI